MAYHKDQRTPQVMVIHLALMAHLKQLPDTRTHTPNFVKLRCVREKNQNAKPRYERRTKKMYCSMIKVFSILNADGITITITCLVLSWH